MWLTVWHSDMFGRNDFLGEVMLPLQGVPMDDPTPRWYGLQDRVRSAFLQFFRYRESHVGWPFVNKEKE